MGALHKLGVGNVYAAHMYIKDNFAFEHEDVELLQKTYGFGLKYISPDNNEDYWQKYVKSSLLNVTMNSMRSTLPSYRKSAEWMASVVPSGTVALTGELCLLDAGFSDSSDSTRNYRRCLYRGGGRWLAMGAKLLPNQFMIDWDKHRYVKFSSLGKAEKMRIWFYYLISALYSFGRPGYYYAGMELGYKRGVISAPWIAQSFLPRDYKSNTWDRFYEGLFEDFENMMVKNSWKASIDTMLNSWYSEFSSMTMANDSAAFGKLSYCMPFSSVDCQDYQSSLPEKWKKDKKIQKDMCAQYFGMPKQVAYRMKNHARQTPYEVMAYPWLATPAFKKWIMNKVKEMDFGPLNKGLSRWTELGSYSFTQLFFYFGLILQMEEYGLKVE